MLKERCSDDFLGNLVTEWDCHRTMKTKEPFSYTDPNGKVWPVPCGSELNGATIPRPLWSVIGSPYVGEYRRASVVHDYFVGEGENPDVGSKKRKEADRMFFNACISDGCSEDFAKILYIGVRIGSWIATRFPKKFRKEIFGGETEYVPHSATFDFVLKRFLELIDKVKKDIGLDKVALDQLEALINRELEIEEVSSQ